jgi:hypothetical protein
MLLPIFQVQKTGKETPRWRDKYKSRVHPLVPMPTSLGINAPQATTLHTVCSSSTQNVAIRISTIRVKSGRRSMYDRSRVGLNGRGGSAIAMPSRRLVRTRWIARSGSDGCSSLGVGFVSEIHRTGRSMEAVK